MKSEFYNKNKKVKKLVIAALVFSIFGLNIVPSIYIVIKKSLLKIILGIPCVALILILLIIPYIMLIKIPPITSCSDEYTTTLVDITIYKTRHC